MKFLCVFFLSLVTLPGVCEGLQISEAWSRATVEGRMGAVYATIENTSDHAIRIEGIKTSVAMMAQVHESYLDNGMMRMRHIEQFTIPAGEVRKLAPGGLHIMLMRLPKPL
ncbi:MAG: copper chaperone PCu(A)C, partial [Gammaproteobacteria bacterium]|nr:copper chaperone PCu(A)C [Gammaproteobacteria bacterium]